MIIGAVTFDSGNSEELSDFYQKLLGWSKRHYNAGGENFIAVYSENGPGPRLVFQEVSNYEKPVWPLKQGLQQQMVHLDFYVTQDEYEPAIQHAISCGAIVSEEQLSGEWIVMLDPAGHPFCIGPILPLKRS